jgi:hypothetical protein
LLDFQQFANFTNCEKLSTMKISLSLKEVAFLTALLDTDKQTALQLLAADHFYRPSLLPKLQKLERALQLQEKEAMERQGEC